MNSPGPDGKMPLGGWRKTHFTSPARTASIFVPAVPTGIWRLPAESEDDEPIVGEAGGREEQEGAAGGEAMGDARPDRREEASLRAS